MPSRGHDFGRLGAFGVGRSGIWRAASRRGAGGGRHDDKEEVETGA